MKLNQNARENAGILIQPKLRGKKEEKMKTKE